MKRFMIMTALLITLLFSAAACAKNTVTEDQASTSDGTAQEQQEEKVEGEDFKGDPNGNPGGDRISYDYVYSGFPCCWP